MGIASFLSAEFLLRSKPNDGTIVRLRAAWVTLLFLALLLPAKAYLAEGTVLEFSVEQLKKECGEMIPWAGAIFAAAYAAFYARFSAQWNYLATLYNQLMASSVTLPQAEIESNDSLQVWKAAFIEDAQDLHLAGKSMFRTMIVQLLDDEGVTETFVDSVDNGKDRLALLERNLNFTAKRKVGTDVEVAAPEAVVQPSVI